MRRWLVSAFLVGGCYHADFSNTHYLCADGVCPTGFVCVAGVCESTTPRDGDVEGPPGMDADASTISWWDPAFTKRARLNVTDAATAALGTGFQIGVLVDLAALDSSTATWDSVRVVRFDANGQTWSERLRYIEGQGGVRTVWFKLDAPVPSMMSTTDYWLYFGNPSPPAVPDAGGSIFDFYDAFGGAAVDTASWAIQGTPTVASGQLTLKPNDSIRTNQQFAPGHAVTFALKAPNNAPRFWGGFQRQTDFTDSDPWLIWINRDTSDTNSPPGVVAGTIWPETNISAIGMTKSDWGTAHALDGGTHYYTLERVNDRLTYKFEEQMAYQFVLPSAFTTPQQVRLTNEGTANITFSVAYVRQAVSPDPTVTIGPVQTR